MNRKSSLFAALAVAGAVASTSALAQADLDAEVGSLLVFPLFEITGAPANPVTEIRISNTNLSQSTYVHLLSNCGFPKPINVPVAGKGICDGENRTIYLTPRETRVIDVEQFFQPQCSEGFIIAYAVNNDYEFLETNFDYLIGATKITRKSPKRGMAEQAIAFEANGETNQDDGNLTFCSEDTADENCDYDQAPGSLYSDFRGTEFNPLRGTEVALATLDMIHDGQNYPTKVDLRYWNEGEDPFSAGHEFWCWDRFRLDHISNFFKVNNLGSTYGLLHVIPDDNGYDGEKAVVGMVRDMDSGFNMMRNMLRPTDEGRDATYVPDTQ